LAEEKPAAPMLHIGGTGGAYFLAEPGELVIELEKRDLNRSGRRADLRAILVGPDRQVLQDVTILDDGQVQGSGPGPIQMARLSAQVPSKGVYGLNITVSNDRYGTEVTWGFRANCIRYLIETSRGHRDARREEPIVLADPDRARDVCFLPRRGKFGIEVSQLPKGAEMPAVYDHDGKLVETLISTADGLATATIPADPKRAAAPWRLHLPRGQAQVQIDGVTRWEIGDAYPNLPLWTSDETSWFSLHEYRWLLTPYRRTAYGEAGSEHAIGFRVHNIADEQRIIRLELEFPDQPWEARVATEEVTLAGAHGRPFQYAKSLKPNESGGGWTEAVPTGGEWNQTYIGLVCDANDTLHVVSRVWRYGEEPHPASYFATLAYQRKRVGGPWESPKSLVVPPFSEYSVFYHRLTADRVGRLFLSYDCWSTYWFYRTDHPGDRRALMMSPDGGGHWKLVETSDLVR